MEGSGTLHHDVRMHRMVCGVMLWGDWIEIGRWKHSERLASFPGSHTPERKH